MDIGLATAPHWCGTPARGFAFMLLLMSGVTILITLHTQLSPARRIWTSERLLRMLIGSKTGMQQGTFRNFSDALSFVVGQPKLMGYIWPRSSTNETHTRLVNQLNYLKKYKPRALRRLKGGGAQGVGGGTSAPMKVILRVGVVEKWEIYKEGQQFFLNDKCPINRCFLTMDNNLKETADALLVIRLDHITVKHFLPKPRHQIWIARHWEPPCFNSIDTYAVKELINWTASFRRESTLFLSSYGNFFPVSSNRSDHSRATRPIYPRINYAKGKTKKVAMLVSNCNPVSNRMRYTDQLKQYTHVDVYGDCGDHRCPSGFPRVNIYCAKWISEQYKFFLSFENSNCKDYITEKFFENGLRYEAA